MQRSPAGYDFSAALGSFPGRVLIVGSSCGYLRDEWQEKHHLPLFPRAELLRAPGKSHMDLFDDQLVARVRGFLIGGRP